MSNVSSSGTESEIDLLRLLKVILRRKKTIARFVLVFGFIGLFIAVFSEKEYIASTIVVPQSANNKVGGNLGGLAAIAGINLGRGNTASNISPNLYPKIVRSIPFQKEMLNTFLKFSNKNKEITYKDYYQKYKGIGVLSFIKEYTIGLPSKLSSLFKKEEVIDHKSIKDAIYRVSIEENALSKQLQEQLSLVVNSKDGFIEISFSMPEALPAAQMAKKVQELLQKAIIDFKTEKVQDEFNFIKERYNELKNNFEVKQTVLANFRDRNRNLMTSRSQSHLERLQSEYNLAYSVYSEVAKQLEMQRIKLKENTPVFTVIQPVSVPVMKSKPRRIIILAIWLLLGVIIGSATVLAKDWFKKLDQRM
ncbi:probable lipopolysaccharide biosynthesis protein. Putative chain length determinant protein [Tenacibaculum maritimum]|uniref:Wzz/FepE/Etk N-terminal domain-containing protein n=1 Tax=Tenacibaculum maritimum TaxID=107401 RepID=UPI0012E5391A|nr:Wzz/FepE/Etk N-terminal domain-containing protein [Tenacibaculum maritimum]CAA0219327.1 probable lipopolysaccharide biosynthesis protein. Putative chain length determinant protein [Tenacibaculum maritimum]CAA0255200.1 probable lipopolysaccharide biosynthesis protein. Putative chain length determinant protein [Tenacibaculum maritimum]CAA0260195.1 probable lipopolysaccharide biosynthesis protein. Putative chain length determinant protein [Tenacibaculum maritimum]